MAEDTYTKADLDAAVEKATGDVQGLKDKIEELIGDNKKLKDQVRRAGEIKPEDLAAVEKERDDLQAKLAEQTKAAKEAATRAEKAEKALTAEQTFTHKLVAENGVVAELTKAGVTDPAYLEAAKALHLSQVKVVTEGENRTAMYGDKPLADAIKEWAGGDVGKKFVAAPVNGGGGAGGSNGQGGGGKTATRAQIDAMSHGDRTSFFRDGGKVVDQAA
jgi:hypothetical protein